MAGGVCLTFDDCSLDTWIDAVPLFTLARVRATFFISYFPHAVDASGLSKLQFLASAEHEIGCHSTHHYHPETFLKTFTEDEYLRTEVFPALRAMRACGFSCTSWCYPYNAHTPGLTARLETLFAVQRARADTPEDALASRGDRFLRGRSIDTYVMGQPGQVKDIAPTLELLDRASSSDRIAVLYGHDIAQAATQGHATAPEALMAIISKARELKLKFWTASEIAHA